MTEPRTLGRAEVAGQLRALGVRAGGVLLVHTAFRRVRPVEGGPAGLIDALTEALGPEGTLVMPSWAGEDDRVFDPAHAPADAELGVVADTFWRLPGVRRSAHPFAFAARGPDAGLVLADALPVPPHAAASPVGRVRDLDGQVLLFGIDHTSDTTLHLAELEGGAPYRTPKHVTVAGPDGAPRRVDYGENDHCCERFALADGWLRAAGLQREGTVGHAHARLARARDVVGVAAARVREDPLVFLHPAGAGCAECDAARATVPGAAPA